MSRLQRQVQAMIADAGGYWRPINAVARLLEELAELGEALGSPGTGGERLSGEFGDLAIIGTCLANQFNMTLADEVPGDRHAGGEPACFVRLVQDAGQIARVVNYYDGPKNPRSFDGFPTLTAALRTFHGTLRTLAADHGVDLDAAAEAKIAAAPRDRGRFAVSFDPSTADSLRAFQAVRQSARRPASPAARLWGAPPWDGRLAIEPNVDRVLPFLTCFAKAAEPELLDGFVIRLDDGPETGDLPALSRYVAGVLAGLNARDPRPGVSPSVRAPADGLAPGRPFSFHGTRLAVSVFTPLDEPLHPLHGGRGTGGQGTFVLFQPATSGAAV